MQQNDSRLPGDAPAQEEVPQDAAMEQDAGHYNASPAVLQPVPQQHKGHLFFELGSVWVDGPPGGGAEDAYLKGLMRKASAGTGSEAEAAVGAEGRTTDDSGR